LGLVGTPLSMSIPTLQGQLDELNARAEHYRKRLFKLQISKALVLRQLNAALNAVTYPGISKLLPEIISQIFTFCLPDSRTADPSNAPMVLMHVCRKWRKIAQATPALWTVFKVDVEDLGDLSPDVFEPYLLNWLDRARSLPLSLSLTGNIAHRLGYSRMEDIIGEYMPQLRYLELQIRGDSQQDVFEGSKTLPQLRELSLLGCIPRFLSRSSWHQLTKFSGTASRMNVLLRALQLAPNLVECAFSGDDDDFVDDDEEIDMDEELITSVSHPTLKSLRLSYCIEALISLTLPALEHLEIIETCGTGDELLVSFLTRSSPPLRSLSTGLVPTLQCYLALPHLQDLTLRLFTEEQIFDLFVLLRGDPEAFLPHLQHLAFMGSKLTRAESYQSLFNALTWRYNSRHRLEVFRLETKMFSLIDGEFPPLPFADLVAQGMDIHIGCDQENYIWLFSASE
ncbi:hypothetical protein DFH09DRAFT_1178552, partial [Mycena vulgaris]